jgi:hypothetical protein
MRSLLSDGHFLSVAGASKFILTSLSSMFCASLSFSEASSRFDHVTIEATAVQDGVQPAAR